MFSRLLLLIPVLVLVSCGSVSGLKSSTGTQITAVTRSYTRVLVRDFTHTVSDDDGTTPIAARKFADTIATAVKSASPATPVTRQGTAGSGTLVINGVVTRYMEGNAALRLFVGMGAGSSYFDATVQFSDGATGASLGSLTVDKNSWALGGIMAYPNRPILYERWSPKDGVRGK
jgi:Domain of unknown function (DUF4410)